MSDPRKPQGDQEGEFDIDSWLQDLDTTDEPPADEDIPAFLRQHQPVTPPKPVTPPPAPKPTNSRVGQMLADATAEIERLEQELQTASLDLQTVTRERDDATKANTALDAEVKRLQNELQSAINQRDEASKEVKRLTAILQPLVQPFIVFLTAIGYTVTNKK
jgi:regulator of replication initiation timing